MKISVTTAKSGKINIYADGEYMFTVNAVLWYSSHFHDGDEISFDDLQSLKTDSEMHEAYESAMRMLSLRAHSEFELKRKLQVKYSVEAVSKVLKKLKASGLLDDKKYAEILSEELYRRKGYAPSRILIELKNRGIDSIIAQNAVNILDIDREISIIRVIEKLHIDENSTEKEKQRAIRRLLNMGYTYGEISKYIKECYYE